MVTYSVITICRNAENEIAKTIESVLAQKVDMEQIELVVVDGLSNDNTVKIVESYYKSAEQVGLKINLVSEKDKGIYDAMNKGAVLAMGEWCLYLNAGDTFYNKYSLAALIECDKENFDIVYGNAAHIYDGRYRIVKSNSEKNIDFMHGMEFCHQSCIIRRKYLLENPYTLKYRIAGDCDFFTRAYTRGARFHHIQKVIAIFDKNGVSSMNGAVVEKENSEILYEYGLVNLEKFEKMHRKAMLMLKIRRLIPKKIIKIRHDYIMKKATASWQSINENDGLSMRECI